ncbi:hypothetical protein AYO38_01515 [bacterium SCGC AG-212-C10]|nr:hypothetical protein AYO38_01515 [bacterium SCGC AG-212-C10]
MASDTSHSHWPNPEEAPALEDLSRCVHCGLCVNACPTYAVTGLEVESPRGRIFLARSVAEGTIPLTEVVQSHWDLCLQCRACEAVCPSGVPYGRIMEHTRAQLQDDAPSGKKSRRVRRFILRNVIARPALLRQLVAPARTYSSTPLRRLVRASRALGVAKPLARMESQLPHGQGKRFTLGDGLEQPEVAKKSALLFSGCLMPELFGNVHRATGRVFARNGVALRAPEKQGCCGALHAHDGDLAFARQLARKNIAAFEAAGNEPIIVNSAGCGAAMKEYGDLLAKDERWADRARVFASRVKDATEFLAQDGVVGGEREGLRVTYQDPCHLAHAQRIREQPRTLMASVSGCERVETEGADMCCGAAGIYSLVQPEMSAALRTRKAEQFRKHRPDVIVTANPGCHMQYEAAVREAGIDARVEHIMEFLDRA